LRKSRRSNLKLRPIDIHCPSLAPTHIDQQTIILTKIRIKQNTDIRAGYKKRSEDSPELRWEFGESWNGEAEAVGEDVGVDEEGECECYGC
jgi:hypothetical protein